MEFLPLVAPNKLLLYRVGGGREKRAAPGTENRSFRAQRASSGGGPIGWEYEVSEKTVNMTHRWFWLFVLGFYIAWILRVVLLMPVGTRIDSEWLRLGFSQGLRVLFWIVPALLYLHYVDRARPLSFLRLTVFPRGRGVWLGTGLLAGFLIVSAALAFLFMGASLDKTSTMAGRDWAMLLVLMVFVAVAEEILFRGFIFLHLRAWHPFQRSNLITAFLFLLIHFPGWLYMQGPHWGLVQLGVSVFLIGWFLGLVMEVTQSLWPPIALHFLNNIVSAVILP